MLEPDGSHGDPEQLAEISIGQAVEGPQPLEGL
jgi:hypothetical protein